MSMRLKRANPAWLVADFIQGIGRAIARPVDYSRKLKGHRVLARADYSAATLLGFSDAILSITARQPVLSSALRFTMQAVIFGMLGISEAQRRNASPYHICCASALKAKLARVDRPEIEAATASTRVARRSVLEKDAVILGSRWFAGSAARC